MRAAKRPRGRPRDPALDEAILQAVRELLSSDGYGALTVQAVALRAGVTKPTIYRRWRNRALLIWEAVYGKSTKAELPDTGSIDGDLRAVLRWGVEEVTAPEARASLAGMLADLQKESDLRQLVLDRLVKPEYSRIRAVLERSAQRGELRSDCDLNLLMDALIGTVLARASLVEHALDERFIAGLVDLLISGARRLDARSPRDGSQRTPGRPC